MSDFVILVRDFWYDIFNVLDSYHFDFWGLTPSLVDIIVGFIIFAMSLSLLWRGVRG